MTHRAAELRARTLPGMLAERARATPNEVAYRAKRVCVTEVIDAYRGSPQIAAPGPTAIRVMSQ